MKRGGAERVMSLLYTELSITHNVYLIHYFGEVEYDISGNIINLNLPNEGSTLNKVLNVFRRTSKLRNVLKRIKPDLTISFIGNMQPILTFFPVVVSIRIDLDYSDEFHDKRISDLLMRTLYKFPNIKKIVTVSKAIQNKLETRYGFQNVETIYNPLDFDFVDGMLKHESPFDFKYILAVGGFKSQNGFDLLIKAFAQSDVKDTTKLVILGDGHERGKYEALIYEQGLQGKVLLPGKSKNPFIYMKHAEFYVLSSRYEGFPNVLIEALACGAACVATNCETGPKEIIREGYNGMLIPVGSIPALKDAINLLCEDSDLREKFRMNARDSVQHLEVKKIAAEWLKFLN